MVSFFFLDCIVWFLERESGRYNKKGCCVESGFRESKIGGKEINVAMRLGDMVEIIFYVSEFR